MNVFKQFHRTVYILCTTLLVIPTLPTHASDQQEWHYIAASSANLRERPAADAKIVVKLTIGSPVRLGRVQADWVDVHDGLQGWFGWVRRDLITDTPPTIEGMLKAYRESKPEDLSERRKWLERALAIEPVNLEALEALAEIQQQAGDTKGREQVLAEISRIQNPEVTEIAGERQILFFVQGGSLEPFAYLNNNRVSGLYNGQVELDQLISRFLRAGRRYYLFNHQGERGSVMITQSVIPGSINLEGCTSPVTARVKYQVQHEHKEASFEFASNRKIPQNVHLLARPLTEAEMVIARKLSDEALVRKMSTPSDSSKTEYDRLSAKVVKLALQERRKFTGYVLQTPGATRTIFVTGFHYNASVSQGEHSLDFGAYAMFVYEMDAAGKPRVLYTQVEGGNNSGEMKDFRILGLADINGDGIPDIFTTEDGYEWTANKVHLSSERAGRLGYTLSKIGSGSGC